LGSERQQNSSANGRNVWLGLLGRFILYKETELDRAHVINSNSMGQPTSPVASSSPDGQGIIRFHRKSIHATAITACQYLIRKFSTPFHTTF